MPSRRPLHVSLIAIPEVASSTLHGIHDVLNAFGMLAGFDEAIPRTPPFRVEVVGAAPGPVRLAGGLTAHAHRGIRDVGATDIVIVPAVVLQTRSWQPGRYPEIVAWLRAVHERGAMLCSACSGVFLLAETGLFDGRPATLHWSYASAFRAVFPRVLIRPEQVLVTAGDRGRLVTSGASTSWHDLVLSLIVRHVGPSAAQAVARFFALQWHREGLAPYAVFEGRTDHGDAAVAAAQAWLATHFAAADPVEQMVRQSGLAGRTFKRRFTRATGLAPLAYVQRVRVEEAKRRLERPREPVDEVGWRVGYEEPAFFRRLFKRITGMSPGAYRRQFQIPGFAEPARKPGLPRPARRDGAAGGRPWGRDTAGRAAPAGAAATGGGAARPRERGRTPA
jgi:transcriptional regulator GlxA family with amidase domain